MTTTAKISISLPRGTLEHADRERRSSGESRSEFFRRAVEEFLRRKERREAVDRYVAGYIAEPEADYEEEISETTAVEVLAQESWE